MRGGTKSLLFGVHQIFIHPYTVFVAWCFLYGKPPKLHQFVAIVIHDWGLWGMPDVDGEEAETHPKVVYDWCMYIGRLGGEKWWVFWQRVALEVIGHSRFYARRFKEPLSKLYRADKLAINFYPMWLYLLLGTLSGEISEYMDKYRSGKYKDEKQFEGEQTRMTWFLEARANMTVQGITGKTFETLDK